MKRDLYHKLQQWQHSSRRKPLILRGARQVGKTYLLKEFGKREYQHCLYFNFEDDSSLAQLFSGRLQPETILRALQVKLERNIKPRQDLIIFDEIQECPAALNSLKYFNEKANEYHIIAAGSLLGVKMANNKGFPVGKVNFLNLYPFNFFEFLTALGRDKMRQYLDELQQYIPPPETIHQELIELLKQYMFVGGMPEAVAQYCIDKDVIKVREIHHEILDAYALDFAKHAPSDQIMKITAVWETIPTQLARENKKFIFSAIQGSARAREYETAIQWLADAGLIYRSFNISVPKLPLQGYCDKRAFKVFLLDVGLLAAMGKVSPQAIIAGNKLFFEYNGAFTENFVATELSSVRQELFYWTSSGMAEVDFILTIDDAIVPLEVKAGVSKKKKSLQIYEHKYNPQQILRASLMNLKKDDKLTNIPLYMVQKVFNSDA